MAALVQPDLALFIEHAGWLARAQGLTRLGLIAWLRQRLTARAADRIREQLPLDHPVQRAAEAAVIGVLRRIIEHRASRSWLQDTPGRLVDWPRTYLNAKGVAPSEFWVREPVLLPDAVVLGALATIASTWMRLLDDEVSPDRRRRYEALAAAIEGLPPLLRRASAYTQGVERRLQRADPAAAAKLRVSLDFWTSFFGDDDARILAQLASNLQRSDLESENVDTLLELTAALSIARAALSAPAADLPPTGPWRFRAADLLSGRDRSYSDFVLQSGNLVVRIAKGVPRPPTGKPVAADTLNDILKAMGYHARGNQPDIVITFWHQARPSRFLTALGDAKRNASGSGEDYLRESVEVAATYAVSYGFLMGLTIHGSSGPGFHGSLVPAVTLFCRQGARKVVGVDGDDTDAIVRRFRDDAGELPPFVAFDLERHFSAGDGTWASPALSAWFGRLGRQAWQNLST